MSDRGRGHRVDHVPLRSAVRTSSTVTRAGGHRALKFIQKTLHGGSGVAASTVSTIWTVETGRSWHSVFVMLWIMLLMLGCWWRWWWVPGCVQVFQKIVQLGKVAVDRSRTSSTTSTSGYMVIGLGGYCHFSHHFLVLIDRSRIVLVRVTVVEGWFRRTG